MGGCPGDDDPPEPDILIIPAGESSEFFPLSIITNEVAFLTDSWGSYQLLLVEPMFPPTTVIGDEIIAQLLKERFAGGVIDQSRLQTIQLEIARITKIPLSVVARELSTIDALRQRGAEVVITSTLRSAPSTLRQTQANVVQASTSQATPSTASTPGGMFKITRLPGGSSTKN